MLRAALVVEAPADACTISMLVERVVSEESAEDWVRDADVRHIVEWCGLSERSASVDCDCRTNPRSVDYSTWSALKREGLFSSSRVFRGSDGAKARSYEIAARKALFMARRAFVSGAVNALVLAVDEDGKSERASVFGDVVAGSDFPAVVAVPRRSREAWVLNAFDLGDESRMRFEMKQRTGVDPVVEGHRLGGATGEDRNIKTVVARLVGDGSCAEYELLEQAPLSVLRARGVETGLAAFLDAVRETLLPVFGGKPITPT